MGTRPFKPRKSKLDAFAKMIGQEPDATIAAKANVTSETVRTYRVRRGIPAAWRGEVAGPSAGAAKAGAMAKRPFRGRRSKLDPYTDLLGRLRDSEVATRAGVTVENVRAYRRRRGIPAVWREAQPARSLDSDGPSSNGPSATVRRSRSSARAAGSWAFRVTAQVGGEEQEFVVFGESLSDAAIRAERRLAERNPRARLLAVAVLAEAL